MPSVIQPMLSIDSHSAGHLACNLSDVAFLPFLSFDLMKQVYSMLFESIVAV